MNKTKNKQPQKTELVKPNAPDFSKDKRPEEDLYRIDPTEGPDITQPPASSPDRGHSETATFKPGIPEEHLDDYGLRLRERETQHTGNVVEAEFTVDPHHANTPTLENNPYNQQINTNTGTHLTTAFTQDVSAVTTSGGTSLDINPCDDSD